jgi:hypothetical protein
MKQIKQFFRKLRRNKNLSIILFNLVFFLSINNIPYLAKMDMEETKNQLIEMIVEKTMEGKISLY